MLITQEHLRPQPVAEAAIGQGGPRAIAMRPAPHQPQIHNDIFLKLAERIPPTKTPLASAKDSAR